MVMATKMWANNGRNNMSLRGVVVMLVSSLCLQGSCVLGFMTNHHRSPSRYSIAKVSLNVHQETSELLGSLLSTMYATGIKHIDPHYANGQSIVPIDPDHVAAVKDYFLPTTSDQVTNAAIAAQQKAIQAGASATYDASDFTILKNGPPSFTYNMQQTASTLTPTTKPIDAEELEWIARTFDIFARKIPVAALCYALVDFFFIGANDVYKEDLEEDGPVVVADWVSQSAARVVAAFLIATAVIGFDNLTYHPF